MAIRPLAVGWFRCPTHQRQENLPSLDEKRHEMRCFGSGTWGFLVKKVGTLILHWFAVLGLPPARDATLPRRAQRFWMRPRCRSATAGPHRTGNGAGAMLPATRDWQFLWYERAQADFLGADGAGAAARLRRAGANMIARPTAPRYSPVAADRRQVGLNAAEPAGSVERIGRRIAVRPASSRWSHDVTGGILDPQRSRAGHQAWPSTGSAANPVMQISAQTAGLTGCWRRCRPVVRYRIRAAKAQGADRLRTGGAQTGRLKVPEGPVGVEGVSDSRRWRRSGSVAGSLGVLRRRCGQSASRRASPGRRRGGFQQAAGLPRMAWPGCLIRGASTAARMPRPTRIHLSRSSACAGQRARP